MKELTKIQSYLFMAGGALMVVGMGMFVFLFHQFAASLIFLAGAVIFACLQCMQAYTGTDVTIRRLKSIQNLADLFFVLAGVLMVDTATCFLRPVFTNQEIYIEVLYNKWIILLMISVVLEIYTTHRLSHELEKQKPSDM